MKAIRTISLIAILACFYGLFGSWYFIVPESIYIALNIAPLALFGYVCYIGLAISFALFIFSTEKIHKQNYKKQLAEVDKKIASLAAYKLNYFKLRKKLGYETAK